MKTDSFHFKIKLNKGRGRSFWSSKEKKTEHKGGKKCIRNKLGQKRILSTRKLQQSWGEK